MVEQAAEAALALLKGFDGLQQWCAAEGGPEGLGDGDLGVGDLPQQEVRQAHLARGANNEVEFGQAVGVEVARNRALVDLQVLDAAVARGLIDERVEAVD